MGGEEGAETSVRMLKTKTKSKNVTKKMCWRREMNLAWIKMMWKRHSTSSVTPRSLTTSGLASLCRPLGNFQSSKAFDKLLFGPGFDICLSWPPRTSSSNNFLFVCLWLWSYFLLLSKYRTAFWEVLSWLCSDITSCPQGLTRVLNAILQNIGQSHRVTVISEKTKL